jgi:hypothetical protein
MSEAQHLFGWINRPDLVETVVTNLPHPTFAQAAPDLRDTGEGMDVFFWEYETPALIGKQMADLCETAYQWAQAIGDCVSWGCAQAVQDLLLLQKVQGWLDVFDALVATEPIYGGSRCEIGGWWNDYSDGSIGAYAAKWVSQKEGKGGIILRKKHGNIDLTNYSGQRAKEYGAKGCPDALEPDARLHAISDVTTCRTWEEVRAAVANLKPVSIASDAGFTMKRSANGFCRRSGSWMHQMKIRGVGVAKGNQPFAVIGNNWGDYLGSDNNVITLESGKQVTLPPGHFAVVPEDVTYIARQGDTFAYAGADGWSAATVPHLFG